MLTLADLTGQTDRGLRFAGTESDWSSGSGPLVTGTGESIMMAVTNRRAALCDLSGDGLAVLSERLR